MTVRPEQLVRGLWLVLGALAACSGEHATSHAVYASGEPLGDWYKDEAPATPATPDTPDAGPNSDSMHDGGLPAAPAEVPTGGTGGAAGNVSEADAGSATPSAGAGGRSAASPPAALVEFQFLTLMQHMRELKGSCDSERTDAARAKCQCTAQAEDPLARGPCNAGAVWLTTPTGELVDVLELWGGYRQNLIRYTTVRSTYLATLDQTDGGKLVQHLVVDGISSATLAKHETHHVTWKHTDWRGQAVPAGAYKLVVEVADYDTEMTDGLVQNAVLEVPVNTQTRAQPSLQDQPYFQRLALHYEQD